jgi:hypothetical protein
MVMVEAPLGGGSLLFERMVPVRPAIDIFNFVLGLVRQETRYLLPSTITQKDALDSHNPTLNTSYSVRTLYLDIPTGTWLTGISKRKWRIRRYNGKGPLWFEIKESDGGLVGKYRRKMSESQIDGLGLVPIVMVEYNRTEWEFGKAQSVVGSQDQSSAFKGSLRVTCDMGVTSFQVDRLSAPSKVMLGSATGVSVLDQKIVEVKANGRVPVPNWLKLPKEWDYSKSQWALASLVGLEDKIAPSHAVTLAN